MARKQSKSNEAAGYNNLQFPPERIVRLLVGIKSAIGMAEARAVSFEDLDELSGRPAGTIGSWFEGARMNQLEFLLALLERVPPKLRYDLLDTACRTQPTLHHPKLAHDPVMVSRLEALLKRRAGFTVIRGAPEHSRAFLLHAFGNSSRENNSGQQSVVGMDTYHVAAWTPVPGVCHLSPHADIRQHLQRSWSTVNQVDDGSLVLLGGVWARVSHLHSAIVHLAERCHVIVADDLPNHEDSSRGIPVSVHTLTVAAAREQPEWIRVTIRGG